MKILFKLVLLTGMYSQLAMATDAPMWTNYKGIALGASMETIVKEQSWCKPTNLSGDRCYSGITNKEFSLVSLTFNEKLKDKPLQKISIGMGCEASMRDFLNVVSQLEQAWGHKSSRFLDYGRLDKSKKGQLARWSQNGYTAELMYSKGCISLISAQE